MYCYGKYRVTSKKKAWSPVVMHRLSLNNRKWLYQLCFAVLVLVMVSQLIRKLILQTLMTLFSQTKTK